jgi:hypothetical protein
VAGWMASAKPPAVATASKVFRSERNDIRASL